ncbi:NUDIX domain-containing protein [Bacillus sp. APMAM]|nr:NUDIX domain-containing protein [Bacillus sp. APMAM]RTZ57077.1 NUDIX domain-containing protein [Bacillus sp. SAJ1]
MEKPFHHLARGIFLNDGKILLVQAKGYRNTFLPGGHIEFGENAKDALKREMVEELGIACEVGSFLGIVEHKWQKKGVLNCEVNQIFEVTCSELNHHLTPQSKEEHIEFIWCNIDELEERNLQPYPLREIISSYATGKEKIFWESTINEEIDKNNIN